MAIQEQPLATRRRIGVHADHEHYKWWALSVTSLGMLFATINSGTLIIALPDLFGRKRSFVLGFAVFTLASLGAGFSADGTQLILWRILQGIGGAAIFANAAALVTDAFPKQQLGLAMGTNTMVAAVGLVIGPVLGGALVEISWHWVFWFNIPIGLLGTFWAWSVLHETERREHVTDLDLLGTVLYVAGLTGLVLGVSRGGISGWNDAVTIGG